jgi:hypothetical protein
MTTMPLLHIDCWITFTISPFPSRLVKLNSWSAVKPNFAATCPPPNAKEPCDAMTRTEMQALPFIQPSGRYHLIERCEHRASWWGPDWGQTIDRTRS